jgi:hypothetical protein
MTHYAHSSTTLITAVFESKKAPAEFAGAYALGMAWALLTPEQKADLLRIAKA